MDEQLPEKNMLEINKNLGKKSALEMRKNCNKVWIVKRQKKKGGGRDFNCLKNGSLCNVSKSEMNYFLPKTPQENGGYFFHHV